MSSAILTAAICLIACHGGPADHFATYAEALIEQGYTVHIHATGPALKKFQERGIEVKSSFSLDDLTPEEEDALAQSIAKTCSAAAFVLTDIAHPFDVKIQKALSKTSVPRFAYYDNPEPFVPGGYSSTAAIVAEAADGILFANTTLTGAKIYSSPSKEIDLGGKKLFGIGYYPVSKANEIANRRKADHANLRASFLMKNGLKDKKQKVLVYFGGNNEEYFTKAFPAFLSFLQEASELTNLKNTTIVFQQHPGAKAKNLDGQQLEAWTKEFSQQKKLPKVILSDFSSDESQVLADAAFYYQTSMGPQFVLEGIPAVQIGHETYEDILVRNHLAPTVRSAEEFAQIIKTLDNRNEMPLQDLLNNLGINEDWLGALENAIKQPRP